MELKEQMKQWMGPPPKDPSLFGNVMKDQSMVGQGARLAGSFYPPTAVGMSVHEAAKTNWEEAAWYLLDAMLAKSGVNMYKKFRRKDTKSMVDEIRGTSKSIEQSLGAQ